MSKSIKDLLMGVVIKEVKGDVRIDPWETPLNSLDGCPQIIGGSFTCAQSKITSLEFCPKEIMGNFIFHTSEIESLKGCPEIVHGDFKCNWNAKLKSLEGMPKEVDDFIFQQNGKFGNPFGTKAELREYIQKNCKVNGRVFV